MVVVELPGGPAVRTPRGSNSTAGGTGSIPGRASKPWGSATKK